MITDIEQYRRKKQIQAQKIEMIKVPVYTRVYKAENTLIGEFPTGDTEIIFEFDEED